ncbi:MAG: metallophosphoesterase [Bacteroidales bacterium]|nr:metallophosphoesterase [Bacteroidales bacterium]
MKHTLITITILLFAHFSYAQLSSRDAGQSNRPTTADNLGMNKPAGVVVTFLKAPYLLYTGENDQMLVLWQMGATQNCLLEWGTDLNYSDGSVTTEEYGEDHQHQVALTGLCPNVKYYYKVSTTDENIKQGSFVAGAQDSDRTISFYAYGDTRTYPANHDMVAAQILQDMSQHPETQTFIISTGDFVANGDREKDWTDQFFDPQYTSLQKMLSELPYMAAVGNHEGQGLLFRKYFPYPRFVSDRYYFSFDYGPAHFMVIDQFTSYAVGSDQYNWLVNDLEATNKDWKFILLHEPGWTAGGVHPNNPEVQEIIQPLCETYGVQIVLTGHNHYYARAVVDGVMHITTGGGGAPLYTPNPFEEKIVTVNKSNHYCKIEIDTDTLSFSAITKDGDLIEGFQLFLSPNNISDKFEEDLFKVYASHRLIKVSNDSFVKGQLSVYDNYGRLVFRDGFVNKEHQVGVDNGGVYFVRIDFEGERVVKKVFVK